MEKTNLLENVSENELMQFLGVRVVELPINPNK